MITNNLAGEPRDSSLQQYNNIPFLTITTAQSNPDPLLQELELPQMQAYLQDRTLKLLYAQSSFPLFRQQFEAMAVYDHELRNTIRTIHLIKTHPCLPEQLKNEWQQREFDNLNKLKQHRIKTMAFYQSALNYCNPLTKIQTPPVPQEQRSPVAQELRQSASLPKAAVRSANTSPEKHSWEQHEKIILLSAAADAYSQKIFSHNGIKDYISRKLPGISKPAILMQFKRVIGIFTDCGTTVPSYYQFSYLRNNQERCKTLIDIAKKHFDERKSAYNGESFKEACKSTAEVIKLLQQNDLEDDKSNSKCKLSFDTATALYSLAIGLANVSNSRLVVEATFNNKNSKNLASGNTPPLSKIMPDAKESIVEFSIFDNAHLDFFAEYAKTAQTTQTNLTANDFMFTNTAPQNIGLNLSRVNSKIKTFLGLFDDEHKEISYLRQHPAERDVMLANMKALISQNKDIKTVINNFSGKINGIEVKLRTKTAIYSLAAGLVPVNRSGLMFKGASLKLKRKAPSADNSSAKKPKT